MKNLWLIIDNPKIGVKEKMKATKLGLDRYNMQFGLLDAEPLIKKFFDGEEKVKSDERDFRIREEEIARREQALQGTLKQES